MKKSFALLLVLGSVFLFACTNELVDYWWESGDNSDIDINGFFELSMPLGAYTAYKTAPRTTGIEDSSSIFAVSDPLSRRMGAQLMWSTGDDIYFEWLFPAPLKGAKKPKELNFSVEIGSELSGQSSNYKSDITIWINGVECATWTCPGDFGDRAGKLKNRPTGETQYGILLKINVSANGTIITTTKDDVISTPVRISNVCIDDLNFPCNSLPVRIGVKAGAVNKGGINIFGSGAGDYPQDLLLSVLY
ncbi:MAG: hypothetical protein Pg6A_01790 [Termitinemataceae bacterium]|nr:MAG: hypothetical protein Pg6A_01790 [Termitinemataceae bacterium]